jgi:hypothetical protein
VYGSPYSERKPVITGDSGGGLRRMPVSRRDRFVRWSRAADVLNVSEDALSDWYDAGLVPQFRTPGLKFTYQSWLDAVMAAARPGKAGDIREVAREWWKAHLPEALEEVAL